MVDSVFIYITCSLKKEAKKFAKHLLAESLIACGNIFPIESFYKWDGKVKHGKEYVLLVKTKEENYLRIVDEIERIHSYSTPCITKIPVSVNDKYGDWMKKELS